MGIDPSKFKIEVSINQPGESENTTVQNTVKSDRDSRFIKMSFSDIRQLVPDTASRLILVIKAYSDMQTSKQNGEWVKLTSARCADAGIASRYQKMRAIAKLERMGAIVVQRREGKSSLARLSVQRAVCTSDLKNKNVL